MIRKPLFMTVVFLTTFTVIHAQPGPPDPPAPSPINNHEIILILLGFMLGLITLLKQKTKNANP